MSSNALRFPGGEAALRHGFAALERRLPLLVSIALLLATAWLLAGLTWMLLPTPAESPPIYSSGKQAGAAPRTPDIGALVNQHLFGNASASAQPTGNAPETTLALTLNGIAAGADQQHSRAIILANGKQDTYGVGAQLPGGAVIKAILADRVLLSL
ncbi:MAG TPA: type II secretion system protein N, partial [Gammaproteobacteria bacterium]|nr:type II secretion system protein N [Gammaproteobacteria bacterium]